jgi:hypothetical protein
MPKSQPSVPEWWCRRESEKTGDRSQESGENKSRKKFSLVKKDRRFHRRIIKQMSIRIKYIAIAVSIFVTEVLIATVFSHVAIVRGSLGDFLVVMLIYFAVQSVKRFKPVHLAIGVFLFACGVETSQYFHVATLLHFRPGTIPYILMGDSFSWSDIGMYLLGAGAASVLDYWIIKK